MLNLVQCFLTVFFMRLIFETQRHVARSLFFLDFIDDLPALFHKLISAGLPPCFARWTQSFLSDRRASVVFQNHKSRSFRVRRGVPQGSVLGPVFFSLFINDLPASLPSSVSCSLYADNLAIWSSSPLVSTALETTQGALFRLERWSKYWCLPLNPSKCEASFYSMDPHQANFPKTN